MIPTKTIKTRKYLRIQETNHAGNREWKFRFVEKTVEIKSNFDETVLEEKVVKQDGIGTLTYTKKGAVVTPKSERRAKLAEMLDYADANRYELLQSSANISVIYSIVR